MQAAYLRIAVIHADGDFFKRVPVDVFVLKQRLQTLVRNSRDSRAYLPLDVYAAVYVLVYLAFKVYYPRGYLTYAVVRR